LHVAAGNNHMRCAGLYDCFCRLVSQSINQSINQSISQSINQSTIFATVIPCMNCSTWITWTTSSLSVTKLLILDLNYSFFLQYLILYSPKNLVSFESQSWSHKGIVDSHFPSTVRVIQCFKFSTSNQTIQCNWTYTVYAFDSYKGVLICRCSHSSSGKCQCYWQSRKDKLAPCCVQWSCWGTKLHLICAVKTNWRKLHLLFRALYIYF